MRFMHVHVVQHVPYEGPGLVSEWLASRQSVVTTQLALTEEYPQPSGVDLLVVMGGPMAADDEQHNPWLMTEKRFVRDVLDAGGRVLGICLGAQILAEVLGGGVRRNAEPEIGWFPLESTGVRSAVLDALPDGLVVGHWHGDAFDAPPGALVTHTSAATAQQAFIAEDGRALGMQFHLEWDAAALDGLVERHSDELAPAPFVQTTAQLRAGQALHASVCRAALFELLDRFCGVERS